MDEGKKGRLTIPGRTTAARIRFLHLFVSPRVAGTLGCFREPLRGNAGEQRQEICTVHNVRQASISSTTLVV